MYTTHFGRSGLGSLVGMGRRKLLENMDEFVQQGLTLYAKKEVFEIVIVQMDRPAAVAPELHCRDMHIFFSHIRVGLFSAKSARGVAGKITCL